MGNDVSKKNTYDIELSKANGIKVKASLKEEKKRMKSEHQGKISTKRSKCWKICKLLYIFIIYIILFYNYFLLLISIILYYFLIMQIKNVFIIQYMLKLIIYHAKNFL